MDLGMIEGFFGEPWSWEDRRDSAGFLARAGYSFYIYAPKGDSHLRKRWRDPVPSDWAANLRELGDALHSEGVEYGVGLSPYELYFEWNREGRRALVRRVVELDELGVDRLAVIFDDMNGDLPRLAEIQAEILDAVLQVSRAKRFVMCPTYYSDDPVLEKVFGKAPTNYLEELGTRLDRRVEVFWTGPKVCSTEVSIEHLKSVGSRLGRKPFLWDNYPVNDGNRMCKFLHLRGFTGRPSGIAELISGHAVNPMNQAHLSRIPALTLRESYLLGEDYSAIGAFRRAAAAVGGAEFARRLEADLPIFQDDGLERISAPRKAELIRSYGGFGTPPAREIVDWLSQRYEVSRELVLTQ